MNRPLLITIDGDGFIYRTAYDGRRVRQVIYDEILTRYPFQFCASVIAGESGTCTEEFDVDLARKIFALPNISAASHSWGHPHDWRKAGVDLEREIGDSTRYINEELLQPGKQVTTFLWTGLCNPDERCLGTVASHDLSNLNGGNPGDSFTRIGDHKHFHSRAPNDWTLMDLEERIIKQSRGPVYPYLKSFKGNLGSCDRVIDYFTYHPARPVHLYFHWYSAVRRDSLAALVRVLDWCRAQCLQSVSIEQYIDNCNDSVHEIPKIVIAKE